MTVNGYTDFANKLLMALYQEAEGPNANARFEDTLAKYGLPASAKWLEGLTDEWKANGFVDVDSYIGSPLKWRAEIAGPGMRHIEQVFGSKDGVGTLIEPVSVVEDAILTEDGRPILAETGQPIVLESSRGLSEAVDSRSWTGKQHILIDSVVIDKVRGHAEELRRLVYEIHIPNNAQSSDLKALVDVLMEVLAMCEPEATLIDRILASPKFKASATLIGAVAAVRGAFSF